MIQLDIKHFGVILFIYLCFTYSNALVGFYAQRNDAYLKWNNEEIFFEKTTLVTGSHTRLFREHIPCKKISLPLA